MNIARPAMKLAVLAATGAMVLAACGKSSTGGGSQSLGPAGAFGKVPAQSGTPHAGTVTVAAPPATEANWIMPLITGADNSVYTVLSFDYQMFRPLYWTVKGVVPVLDPALSLADTPVYSNGDTKVSITLKSNYKWSDGQPITSKDILFWFDLMKAAVKLSPANWAPFTPGLGLPDEVSSVHHEEGGQPVLVHPRPARHHSADAVARLGQGLRERPDAGLHQPGERDEDL